MAPITAPAITAAERMRIPTSQATLAAAPASIPKPDIMPPIMAATPAASSVTAGASMKNAKAPVAIAHIAVGSAISHWAMSPNP